MKVLKSFFSILFDLSFDGMYGLFWIGLGGGGIGGLVIGVFCVFVVGC